MSRHATLSLLVRQAALQSFARQFAEEYSEELATIPTLAPMVAKVQELASKAKAIGPAERSAGQALYRAIRDEFDALLTTTKVDKSLKAQPMAAAYVSTGALESALNRARLDEQNAKARAAVAIAPSAPKVRSVEAATFSTPKGRKVKSKLQTDRSGLVARTVTTEELPIVRTNPVPSLYHAWNAFFHDCRHVASTQASGWHTEKTEIVRKGSPLTIENLGKHTIRKDGVEVVQYENGAERVITAQGLSPRTVLERHMDLIGSIPAGMLVLRQWRGGLLSDTAALDRARNLIHMDRHGRDRWVLGRAEQPDLSEFTARQPNGNPTADLLERRHVASVRVDAAVRSGRNWTPLAAKEDVPYWDVKVQGGWIVGPRGPRRIANV